MKLLDSIRDCIKQFPDTTTFWIAYSGGMDSHVLLALCHQLRMEMKLTFRVIHINHNISPHAKSWAQHCKKICADYQMDYLERSIQLDLKRGESLEEEAREKRHGIFADLIRQGDVLLTAHHEDDQAETVLLQLLRGAGPKGLSAMPAIKSFAEGYHARPMLTFPRKDLLQVATENQLQWIEDESNQDVALSRNFIRHEILPALTSHWPSATTSIARSALHCAENQLSLDEYLQADYQQLQGSRPSTLSVAKLLQLDHAKQKGMLRAFIHQAGFPLPSTRKMQAILQDVLLAAWDKSPVVTWGSAVLRRHGDDIHLLSAGNAVDTEFSCQWEIEKPLVLPHGVLQARKTKGKGLRADIKCVSIGFRQGGEVIEVKGRGRQSLKNLFQEWKILPWERECLPLIFAEQQLIAIPQLFLHADFRAGFDEWGWEIFFEIAS